MADVFFLLSNVGIFCFLYKAVDVFFLSIVDKSTRSFDIFLFLYKISNISIRWTIEINPCLVF
jgi:hypothetical protein